MKLLLISAAALALAAGANAAVTITDLAKPPADAEQITIMSTAGRHGVSYRWTTPDGVLHGRESMDLRGQVFEQDSAARVGADGTLSELTIRGFSPQGDMGETYRANSGLATWKSQVDGGSARYTGPVEYLAFGGPMDLTGQFIEAVIRSPDKTLALLPGGRAHAERLTSVDVGAGAAKRTITLYAVTGVFNTPVPIWVDDKGRFFALDQGITWIRAGYESDQPAIDKAQDTAMSARSPVLARQLGKPASGPIAFVHVRDFEGGDHFADDRTVVVDHGRIVADGPSASTPPPSEATVVDGRGKTLVPGLWDSHHHFGDDSSGPFLLSLGITSIRDPGNNNTLTLARRERRAKGDLLMPHVYPSVLIDGKGPYTAQLGSVATSQAEAIAITDKAKADGFTAIKFYGTFNPDWVAATAAEAHRLGLHVHGHIPAGMRTMDAINDGYDEITHIYFVAMQAMPESVVKVSNGIARMQGPAKYFKDVDLNSEPMKTVIQTMAARHIVSDPTLVVVEALTVPENGDLAPEYAPYAGTLPPTVERGFRQGGLALEPGYTRADYRKSFANLVALVGVLHKAGVPIVAGTDGSGMELVRELELYEQAGFTPEEALESATIVPARNVHAEDHTGSIAVGKDADLVLVAGDPARNIGDLRHVKMVLMDGKVMDGDALRAAGGFSGVPKEFDDIAR